MPPRSARFFAAFSFAAAGAAALATWLAPAATLQAAGRGALAASGLSDAGMFDRSVAWVFRTAGWDTATALRGLVVWGFWWVALLLVAWVCRKVSSRLRSRMGAVVAGRAPWFLTALIGLVGLWDGFQAWRTLPAGRDLIAPIALVEEASKAGGPVFFNPAAAPFIGALAPQWLGAPGLKERAGAMNSIVRWRELDRTYGFRAVLIAGRVSEARLLIGHLLSAPGWYLAAVDHQGILFLRGDGLDFSPADGDVPETSLRGRERAFLVARTALNYHEAGLKTAARALMNEALDAAPDDVGVLVCAASLAASQGRWDRCRTYAERALEQDPGSLQARELVALSLLETNVPEKAHEAASALVRKLPDDPQVLLLHARTARAARDPAAEIASLEKLLKISEASGGGAARIHIYLGQAWAQRGFADLALKSYRAALEGDLSPAEAADVKGAIKTIEDNRLPPSPR